MMTTDEPEFIERTIKDYFQQIDSLHRNKIGGHKIVDKFARQRRQSSFVRLLFTTMQNLHVSRSARFPKSRHTAPSVVFPTP